MNFVTVNSIYDTDPDAHEVARLPGEALEQTGSDEASQKLAAPGTDGLFAAPDGRSRTSAKNNFLLYAGVGMVALLTAAGYFIVHSTRPHHPLQATQTSMVHLAGAPPISIAQLAPSASLAKVPLPKSPPAILHQKYVPQPLSVELSELDGFRLGTPPNNPGITPPQALPSPGVIGTPQKALTPAAAITHPTTAQAAPTGLLAPHVRPTAPNLGANPASPGSHLKLASISPPKPFLPLVAPTATEPAGQVSVPAKASTTAPSQPAIPTSGVTLAAAQAGSLSPAQQTELFQLVTELATMERDDRIKQAVLTGEVEQLSALTTNRLEDYDRRLSMLEAQTAVSGAMQAGSNSAVEAAMAPSPVVPAAVNANASNTASAAPPQAVPAEPAAPSAPAQTSSGPQVTVQYHVQAASPGLAMLSVVGGDGSPLEVQIGDIIPGYGKVLAVVQQGDSWIVQTQSGNIE